ncbi:MAG: Holliday junction resolvase RuvX [Campylobacterota bacterium]|nr:Holliday junction resolvase RuvX [Campylobacterota bacterium]
MRYFAMDLGLKRIGIAYSPDGKMASPLKTIARKNRNQAAAEVKALLLEWDAEALIVGIPMGGSSEDEMRRRVAHFLKLVDFSGEIFYQDESDSSLEAEALMKGEISYRRDGRVDSIAAMIILKRYLKLI